MRGGPRTSSPARAGPPRDVLGWVYAVAQRQGLRSAVVDRGEDLSYADLWRWSQRIAGHLIDAGVEIGDRVGLGLDSSAAYVAALLGVWSAGAAFVPLPSEVPVDRRRRILAEVRPRCLLRAAEVRRLRPPPRSRGQGGEGVGEGEGEGEGRGELLPPRRRPKHSDLAYVIYTSGSSGEPKGVMVPHRGIVGLLRAQVSAFGLGPDSRSLFVLSPAFDASISDIGTALFAGAALVIAERDAIREPASLLAALERESITSIDLPPALLPHLDPQALPRSLETMIIGGEPCDPALVRSFAEVVRVVNVYGPTEATVCSSLVRCDPLTWRRPLLGEPLPGVVYRVLDEEGRDVLSGGAGELLIGGEGLALGYLGRPALTAERFIVHRGERLYRSGDRVRLGADDSLEFLGRLDRQRKIGGVRIELGEVEALLSRHPEVLEAALIEGERSSLLAAVVLREPAREGTREATRRTIADLRAFLRRSLPAAAVPGRIEPLPALPRGTSGKVDRRALLEVMRGEGGREAPRVVASAELLRGAGAGPQGATLALLRAIWSEVLAAPHVAASDRFCDLGGGSLRALEVVAAAQPVGIILSAAALLNNPSLAELASSCGAEQELVSAAALREEAEVLATSLGESAGLIRPGAPPQAEALDPDATVLLTGGTGFLGRHLALLLGRRHRGRIIALVRAADRRRARQRLAAALMEGAPALAAEDREGPKPGVERFELLVGDLTEPRLGLDAARWSSLASEVDAIVHSGAVVNLAADLETLRPANIGGTATILGLAAARRPKLLHLISTLSVFVAASPAVAEPREGDTLRTTSALCGGYAQSKWVAEVLAREVAARGLPLVCHRLGLITGDTRRGVGPARDQLTLFLRGLAQLGLVPEGYAALRVDLSPVDSVARALQALIYADPPGRQRGPTTYHLASPNGASGADLVAALRRAGRSVEPVSRQRWQRSAAERSQRSPAAAVAYLALSRCLDEHAARALRSYDLFQATGFRFDCSAARAQLHPRGLSIPPVTESLLDRYVHAALGARP